MGRKVGLWRKRLSISGHYVTNLDLLHKDSKKGTTWIAYLDFIRHHLSIVEYSPVDL
jgi:hypothetical protein